MASATDVGLNSRQFAHAQQIVAAVKTRRMPERAAEIAIAVALTESGLRVYANRNVPASLNLPHEAVGQDHLSVGIFQQQTPMWGTVADCMGVATSTAKFLHALEKVNWPSMSNWTAAQAVQRSAFRDGSNYRAHDQQARRIVAALWATRTDTPSWYRRLLSVQTPMLRGGDVSIVQHKVGCTTDGVYGPITKKHVQAFQRQHHVTVDGVVGPITARLLEQWNAAEVPASPAP
jgi:peptidoglycan hydrolase-like protein with peptidoglycan-binding domain